MVQGGSVHVLIVTICMTPTEADIIKQMTLNQEGDFHACLEV
jgi:hypothetical protein